MVKVKSQLCAWMTSTAVCVEGFCKVKGKTAAKCAAKEEERDLQLRAQIRTVSFCKELNIKKSSVDVAPTLGVNHVYLVLWFFFFLFMLCFMQLISI